jgi:hypothetical protein
MPRATMYPYWNIDLLKTLAIFLTGSLGGVLAGNGLKSKPKTPIDTPTTTRES